MNNRVYLALGSNIESRADHLYQGLLKLEDHHQIMITNVSSIYETDPVGYVEQEQFLNMVIELATNLLPLELLAVTQEIERESGRRKIIHWGPRTLDLDILLYNQENIKMDNLQIPHPRMSERSFVIVPLQEINPTIRVSDRDKKISQIYHELTDKEGVRLWKKRSGEGKFGLFGN